MGRHNRGGFSLIELMIIIAIIGILIALLLPALSRAKAKAARTACINNQKQLAVALLLYTERDAGGCFPATNLSANVSTDVRGRRISNNISVSYGFFIAPELGGQTRVFQCPADTFTDAGKWGIVKLSDYKEWGTSYGFNGQNFPTNVPPPYSGLAGVPLKRVARPERTVLTYDSPVLRGYTWHGSRQEPRAEPVRNVMSFVDGHAEFLRTVTPALISFNSGVLSEPPASFGYQWNAN
jgi:prepilin-type N-terminal cleavage/methylation domain-containing protein